MDQGTLFLLIALTIVAIVIGGYIGYLRRRGRAARRSIEAQVSRMAPDKVEIEADA